MIVSRVFKSRQRKRKNISIVLSSQGFKGFIFESLLIFHSADNHHEAITRRVLRHFDTLQNIYAVI